MEKASVEVSERKGVNELGGRFEEGNLLSVLATAGEMDIARSPQVYRKDGASFASPNRFWQEINDAQLYNRDNDLRPRSVGPTSASDGRTEDERGGNAEGGCKTCNCRSTGCLKRYCDCFKGGLYCSGNCSCQNCKNNEGHLEEREKAITITLGRDPNAFRPKIVKSQETVREEPSRPGRALDRVNKPALNSACLTVCQDAKHNRGCSCKKTACLKGYCECFQAGVYCSDLCKCTKCKNYDGSVELQNLRASHAESGAAQIEIEERTEPGQAKRMRIDLAPSAPTAAPAPSDRLLPDSPAAAGGIMMTPILNRGFFRSPKAGPRTRSHQAVGLLQEQCNRLVQTAQLELHHIAAERKRRRRDELDGDNDARGSDPGEEDVQRTVERAVMEETAAMLLTYTQMMQLRSRG